jgi:hypothetical protein
LFSFAKNPKASMIHIRNHQLEENFFLPLSSEALSQLSELQVLLLESNMDLDEKDIWHYSWGCLFIPKKAYTAMRGNIPASPLFKWLWKSSNLGKHKFFFWLLIRDRLNTRNLLRRKNRVLQSYNCVLCDSGAEETLFHLFFDCSFSRDCWNALHIFWDDSLDRLDMIIEARRLFGHNIFREIVITACWIIWKTRNGIIFYHGDRNFNRWKCHFKDELGLVCINAKPDIKTPLSTWLQQFS